MRLAGLVASLALVAASCGGTAAPGDDGIQVVVTTTILGDIVSNVAGADATVEVLLPIGADPHDFRASARQVALMESADLIVANGLGLEEGLSDILGSLRSDGSTVLVIGDLVDPMNREGGGVDPHVWMDPTRMMRAVAEIAVALEAVDPTGAWTERGDAYAATLEALDAEITATLQTLPTRQIVSNHDSLGYFAHRYELEVVGVVIPGGSTLSEPSSADLADLVAMIESSGVKTLFTETTESSTLSEAVAAEGEDISLVELYVGSLGVADSGAATYVEMLRTDARLIQEALTS
jgi:zinc/manganese transport system substrate-binding protein